MRHLKTIAVASAILLGACGEEEEEPKLNVANGPTEAGLTSHWAANPCIGASIRVAFAADGTGHYKDAWCDRSITWTSPNPTTVLIAYPVSCGTGLASIQDISGGVGSGNMMGRGYRTDGYSPDTCTFTLNYGPIP